MIDEVQHAATGVHAEHRFIRVRGVRLHYLCAGQGQPVVMVHGLTGSARNWAHNVEALGRSARVYALDLPNMGQSERVWGLDAGLNATANWVVAWMDAIGLGRADIAGHSHGGAVAMMLAGRHGQRVRSLIFFAPANPFSRSSDCMVRFYSSMPGRLLGRLAPHMPSVIQRIALRRMYGDPTRIKPGCLESYVDGMGIPGTMDHLLQIVQRWHEEMGALRTELTKLAGVPVLLVWGDHDRAVSIESGLQLKQELAESEWIVVRGAGHVPFEEMPDICNNLMLGWLERIHRPEFRADAAVSERA